MSADSQMAGKGWWYGATQDQRLAQIDGAIECRMTAEQAAMLFGASETTVNSFANYHGRHFRGQTAKWQRRAETRDAHQRFLAGEPVNFWGQA